MFKFIVLNTSQVAPTYIIFTFVHRPRAKTTCLPAMPHQPRPCQHHWKYVDSLNTFWALRDDHQDCTANTGWRWWSDKHSTCSTSGYQAQFSKSIQRYRSYLELTDAQSSEFLDGGVVLKQAELLDITCVRSLRSILGKAQFCFFVLQDDRSLVNRSSARRLR